MSLAELGGLHFVAWYCVADEPFSHTHSHPVPPSPFSKQAAVMAERFKDAERRRIELDEVHRSISIPTRPHSWLCFISPSPCLLQAQKRFEEEIQERGIHQNEELDRLQAVVDEVRYSQQ